MQTVDWRTCEAKLLVVDLGGSVAEAPVCQFSLLSLNSSGEEPFCLFMFPRPLPYCVNALSRDAQITGILCASRIKPAVWSQTRQECLLVLLASGRR